MPLYDYRCQSCGSVREQYRRYEARDQPASCDCGASLQRVWLIAEAHRRDAAQRMAAAALRASAGSPIAGTPCEPSRIVKELWQ